MAPATQLRLIKTETSIKVPVTFLRPNPYQPEGRLNFSKETIAEMAGSILEYGLIAPPVVRDVGKGYYEMADGWLRRSAFMHLVEAGSYEYNQLPVIVRDLTDQQMADMILEANTVRKDMTPIDKAKLYRTYLDKFKITQGELAEKHHCSQGEIANTLRLLELPEDVQAKIISQEITETHGRVLLQLKEAGVIREYAAMTVAKELTVSALDMLVKLAIGKPAKAEKPAALATPSPKVNPAEVTPETERGIERIMTPRNPAPVETKAPAAETKPVESATKAPETATKQPESVVKTPETVTRPAAAALPSRKLTLTEMADGVMAGVVRITNPLPYMKKLPGTLESVMAGPFFSGRGDSPIAQFLSEAEAWWTKSKEEKK